MPKIIVDRETELKNLSNSKNEIKKIFNSELVIEKEEESKSAKAKNSMPNKPGVVAG